VALSDLRRDCTSNRQPWLTIALNDDLLAYVCLFVDARAACHLAAASTAMRDFNEGAEVDIWSRLYREYYSQTYAKAAIWSRKPAQPQTATTAVDTDNTSSTVRPAAAAESPAGQGIGGCAGSSYSAFHNRFGTPPVLAAMVTVDAANDAAAAGSTASPGSQAGVSLNWASQQVHVDQSGLEAAVDRWESRLAAIGSPKEVYMLCHMADVCQEYSYKQFVRGQHVHLKSSNTSARGSDAVGGSKPGAASSNPYISGAGGNHQGGGEPASPGAAAGEENACSPTPSSSSSAKVVVNGRLVSLGPVSGSSVLDRIRDHVERLEMRYMHERAARGWQKDGRSAAQNALLARIKGFLNHG
jgi:hypothetical protein